MIYLFNKSSVSYKRITTPLILGAASFITITSLTLYNLGKVVAFKQSREEILSGITDYERGLLIRSLDEFTESKLIDEISRLNFKFPHIVLAQAKLETGNFSSKIFHENNNLFGMKEAKVRINLARTTQYNHAYYDSWRESIYDYSLYCATYLHKLKTESEYYEYISKTYAEDPEYINKLQRIVEKERLKELF
jgi:hypothetical protein